MKQRPLSASLRAIIDAAAIDARQRTNHSLKPTPKPEDILTQVAITRALNNEKFPLESDRIIEAFQKTYSNTR